MPRKSLVARWAKLCQSIQFIPLKLGLSSFSNIYISRQLDSQVYFGAHPEFEHLRASFVRLNPKNNGGDLTRLWSFILNCKQIVGEGIVGDFAELGVYRGNTAAILAYYANLHQRRVFLFDTFQGFSSKDLVGIDSEKPESSFNDATIEVARKTIGAAELACEFVPGYFPDSLTDVHRSRTYALVSLDCDLYEPMRAGLEFFYPRMPEGGTFLLHDYSSQFWPGAKLAIDEFCRTNGEHVILMPDKSGSAFLRKSKSSLGTSCT